MGFINLFLIQIIVILLGTAISFLCGFFVARHYYKINEQSFLHDYENAFNERIKKELETINSELDEDVDNLMKN